MDSLCIGHAAYDVLLPVEDFPVENQKIQVSESLESGGGPAANAAFLLGKWGVEGGYAGVIGADHWGDEILKELALVHVDVQLVERRSDEQTPLSTILVNRRTGSRTIVNRTGQRAPLRLSDESLAGIEPKVLLFDGHELTASLQAIEHFPNAISILDAGSLREGTSRLADVVDYVVASEAFALSVCQLDRLTDEHDWKICIDRMSDVNKKPVVVTMGDRGLIFGTGTHVTHIPALDVEATDTTGAGDVFHGAFAWGILHGFDFLATLQLASSAAAISVTRPGARTSIPSLEEATARMS